MGCDMVPHDNTLARTVMELLGTCHSYLMLPPKGGASMLIQWVLHLTAITLVLCATVVLRYLPEGLLVDTPTFGTGAYGIGT